MSNEWTKVELFGQNNDGQKIRFTIADGLAVSKGQLLALVDPRTASAALVTSTVFAGVAAEDHLPNTGITDIAVWTQGVFNAVASAAITIGAPVTGTHTNYVLQAPNGASGAQIIGNSFYALSIAETGNVRLNL